jgi:hypothetical protein
LKHYVSISRAKERLVSDLSQLPPAERITRYRELAKAARLEAMRAKGDDRRAFEKVAEAWERIATITEELIAKRVSEPPEQGVEQKEAALRAPPKTDEPDDSGSSGTA